MDRIREITETKKYERNIPDVRDSGSSFWEKIISTRRGQNTFLRGRGMKLKKK